MAVVIAVAFGALFVGAQLREFRGPSAAASRASATASPAATPTGGKPSPTALSPGASGGPSASPYVKPTPVPTPTPVSGPGGTIRGRVTGLGKPVAGASIRVYAADGFANGPTPVPPTRGEGITDANGEYAVRVPAGAYKVGAYMDETKAYAAGYFWVTWYGNALYIGSSTAVTVVASDHAGLDIAMLKSVTLSGSVVGHDGAPVPNARVDAAPRSGTVTIPLSGATTDAQGTFALRTPALPTTVSAQANGLSRTSVYASLDLDLTGDVSGIRLEVARGNAVAGVIRDAAGAPIANTNFGVVFADDGTPCAGSCGGRTDAMGRFAITVPTATLRFVTYAQGSLPASTSKDYAIASDMTLDPVLSVPSR